MKVICIRLHSGEEIIGQVVDNNVLLSSAPAQFDGIGPWAATGSVTVEMVRGITAQPTGKNEMAIAFFPWSLGNTDGKFMIDLDACAVSVYPAEYNLEVGYLQQTSKAGIQIASGTPGIKF